MNIKLIIFSAIVTSAIGTGIGVGAAEIAAPQFVSQTYQNIHTKYAVIGAAAGLLVGGSQEAIRQLKRQRDREDAELDLLHKLIDRQRNELL
jgi:hypothetical protein